MFVEEKQEFEILAEAKGSQKFKLEKETIICTTLAYVKGANIKGSKAPNAGTAQATTEYGGCEVEKFASCKINEQESKKATIKTNALKSTLAYETKAGAEKEEGPGVALVEPATKGGAVVEYKLSGTCPAGTEGTTSISGSYVVQYVKGEKHTKEQEINSPETPITKYFVNKEGKTEEKKPELLKEVGKGGGVVDTGIGVARLLSTRAWWLLYAF